MKKLATILLTLILVLMLCSVSLAETIEIDTSYDGVVFNYEDINMQIKIPVEWYQAELTEEYLAEGFFDAFATEEGGVLMLCLLESTVEEILAEVETSDNIQDPEIITINGIEALTYVDVDTMLYGTVIPFADGSQSVMLMMGPADDDVIAEQFLTVMASIDTIQ